MTMPKVGRNDPCPCGSGKKYKKCHLDREQQAPVNPYHMANQHRQIMGEGACLHPLAGPGVCSGKIVRAHSVRRAADLLALAVNGHVVERQVSLDTLQRTDGLPEARLVGINQASTFRGFCQKHDTEAFVPIETSPFVGTAEQCFLLFFRAWSRETYAKEGQGRALGLLSDADKGRTVREQHQIQTTLADLREGVALGLRDVRHFKKLLDIAFVAKDYAAVRSIVFETSQPFPIACSGAFYPFHDFAGNEIQSTDLTKTPAPLAVTILNEDGKGYAVLSWFAAASAGPTVFIDALKSQPDFTDAIARVAFSHLENVFANPTWWDGLSAEQQADSIARTIAGARPDVAMPDDLLRMTVAPLLTLPVVRTFAV